MTAAELVGNHSKRELEVMARAKGWRGDYARTSIEQLAQYTVERLPQAGDPANSGATYPELVEHAAEVVAAKVAAPVAAPRSAPRSDTSADARNKHAIAQAIAAALDSVKMGADADEVRAIVREELGSIQPARIVIDTATSSAVKIEDRTHPVFEKVLRLASRGDINVLLVGQAGCGKTTLAHHIAKALKRTFGALHCTAGASEGQLIGYLLPIGDNGRFVYVATEFVRLYQEGSSVFLLDELDAADPNMLLVINSALSNGSLHVPQRYDAPHITRGQNCAIIAAANTFGHGADLVYAGRNQLDAATLDRFYVVEMNYDQGLEAAIAGRPYQPGSAWQAAAAPTAQELRELGEWVDTLRGKVAALKLRRIVSTRMLQKAIAARQAGIPTVEVKRDLLAGWTRDELSKVGE